MKENRNTISAPILHVCLAGVLAVSFPSWTGSQAAQEHALPVSPKTSSDAIIPAAARRTAPDFNLTDSDGKPLRLSAYKGRVVLLNFWATWCGGCKYEMPWFVDFDQQYRTQGLQVVGVSMDDKMAAAKAYLVQKNVPYPSVLGSEALGKEFDLGEMPLTLLIDRQGRIAVRHSGVVDRANLEEHIRQLLRS